MPVTLKDAATYSSSVLARSLAEEIMRESPWLAEMQLQMALEWRRKPWYEKARIRARNWVAAHTPHVHIYLGEHPKDEDW